jgi:hypothetical protein
MSESFSVGERAVFVGYAKGAGRPIDGEVVTIDSTPITDAKYYYGGVGYFIRTDDGMRMDVGIVCLKKIPPLPQREATSSWDDVIVWRPKEKAHV